MDYDRLSNERCIIPFGENGWSFERLLVLLEILFWKKEMSLQMVKVRRRHKYQYLRLYGWS